MFNKKELKIMADAARLLALDAIQTAGSGHPGVALGFADVMTALYANHLRFDPRRGDWPGRDRFILSMGHASALLYAVLHLAGYPLPREKLKLFRRIGGMPGHPERNLAAGIEMTSGPLGQGLASAVGIAMAAPDVKVYAACSDGDLMEGVAMEAASLAGYRGLRNLIVLWDDNRITIDGAPATRDDMPAKFRDMGWNTVELDGMNPGEVDKALGIAKKKKGPVLLACRTVIGYGSAREGTAASHGSPLEYADGLRVISGLTPAFEAAAPMWARLAASKAPQRPAKPARVKAFEMPQLETAPASTRELFAHVIRAAVEKNPGLVIGGSADLSASTGAYAEAGNFIHYGIREHAMGAVMNGLAMGGLFPYGATFLAFSDYMRPPIRLAALMGLPVLFVFSHDSIALGEDGPTHQPVEQLPALRLVPNLRVMRPCNLREVYLCVSEHFKSGGPSAIILSRQSFAPVPESVDADAHGYVASGPRDADVRIVATGSEVALGLAVRSALERRGVSAAVFSAPIIDAVRIGGFAAGGRSAWIEASAQAAPFAADMTVGVAAFGQSGPGADVYMAAGFDAEKIAARLGEKHLR
ncbi:MAG: transketolase family protein [Rickettsiales bacterium]|jgi:transketolase|nr:transketolase family protein [Rickettsiales bacterium]